MGLVIDGDEEEAFGELHAEIRSESFYIGGPPGSSVCVRRDDPRRES